MEKDDAETVKWFRKAAEAGDVRAFNPVAWLLATSANPEIRDWTNAARFAEKAVAATGRKSGAEPDTLATTDAEGGQFEKAASIER